MMTEVPSRKRFETQLAALVEKFSRRKDEYKRADYAELQARIDFIDPFFEALGWDVRNTQELPRHERQVIVESGQTSGRPDYNFRLNGETQFFVEAKAPHVPLESSRVILQAKKYAFNETSQMVMLAATTDFEEFRLYEVRDISYLRRVNKGLIFAYRYDEYLSPKAFDDLWKLSRESVAAGSLDALITPAARRERQRIPLDQQFLSDLVEWRGKLAKAVYKAHAELDADDLNNVVQVFLDRLIFIRVAEDRGVLPENQLREIARHWTESGKSKSLLAELLPLFRLVNQKLNGEIFKPHKCEEMKWDSALVAEIIDEGLEPYNFAQIGVELLGSIYERYLGKTIRVTETRAIVEEKPEVRKAGGVYYTPKYIVDYIVAQTVGKLIEGKTPKQIEKPRVLDPACGSGSFLLGAYQVLLDFHTRYYADEAKKKEANQARLIDAGEGGEFKLSLEQKAQILRNNIFDVDIDPQAVEITMMSLYIKMLEGERGAITGQGVLPRLRDNIKCGNSLLDDFVWESKREGFGEIMEAGGFDAVIGNPPYIKEYVNHQPFHDLRGTKLAKYYQGKMDIWYIFACLAIDLLKDGGLHSFIATNNWITNSGASILRQKILTDTQLHEFLDFGEFRVFQSAGIQTMIYLLQKTKTQHRGRVRYLRIKNADVAAHEVAECLSKGDCDDFVTSFKAALQGGTKGGVFTFVDDREIQVLRRIEKNGRYHLRSQEVAQGIVSPQDYTLESHLPRLRDRNVHTGDGIFVLSDREKRILHPTESEQSIIKPYYTTNELGRYYGNAHNQCWVIYTDTQTIRRIKDYPHIKFHLDTFAPVITSDNRPYGLHRARDEQFFLGEKIVSLRKTDKPQFTYTDFPCYVSQTFFVLKSTDINLKYLVGVLNSRLCHFWLDRKGKKQGNALQVDKAPLLAIPIRVINFADLADKALHDKMVALVERILELHKQKHAAQSDAARERIEREINVTDEQIDALVYELYGLTKEEIKIVEGK
jgi:adenine-specific DNA-methyltransferase